MGFRRCAAWMGLPVSNHEGIRDWLDSWRLAAAVAVLLSIVLGLWSIKLTVDSRNLAEQNRELIIKVDRQSSTVQAVQKARIAADRASRQDQVDNCFSRNATLPGVISLLDALERVVRDTQDKERIRNYIELTREQTPRHRDCIALAKRLNVPLPKVNS